MKIFNIPVIFQMDFNNKLLSAFCGNIEVTNLIHDILCLHEKEKEFKIKLINKER